DSNPNTTDQSTTLTIDGTDSTYISTISSEISGEITSDSSQTSTEELQASTTESSSIGIIIGASVAVLFVLINGIFIVIIFIKREKQKKDNDPENIEMHQVSDFIWD